MSFYCRYNFVFLVIRHNLCNASKPSQKSAVSHAQSELFGQRMATKFWKWT